MDDLIDNLQIYELKKIDKLIEEPKKERILVLKDAQHGSDTIDEHTTMFMYRFKKFF